MKRLLMHVGPSIGNMDVMLSSAADNVGFASAEFVAAMGHSLSGLREIMGAGRDSQPFIIPGSGTSAMESVASFLRPDDRILILTNGVFGNRWEAIFSRYRVKCDVIRAEAGHSVTAELVREKAGDRNYKMAMMTHVETSTGVRAPIAELASELRGNAEMITVDGIASVGGEPANMEKSGIDIFLTASQKAIGAPPGAGLLVASANAMSHLDEKSIAGYALNLVNWLPIMKGMEEGRGGYFATPPVHTILALSKAFSLIEEETLENRFSRHRKAAEMLREGIFAMGLDVVAEAGYRSNTVTGLKLAKSKQKDVLSHALSLGVEFGSGVHPDVKPDYIRIGHMGWVEKHHILRALSVLERALKAAGEDITPGAAVTAAQEFIS